MKGYWFLVLMEIGGFHLVVYQNHKALRVYNEVIIKALLWLSNVQFPISGQDYCATSIATIKCINWSLTLAIMKHCDEEIIGVIDRPFEIRLCNDTIDRVHFIYSHCLGP